MNRHSPGYCPLLASLALLCARCFAAPAVPLPAPSSASACHAMQAQSLPDTRITRAVWVPAGAAIKGGFMHRPIGGQPAHCLVQGETAHHVGKHGTSYGDRFELRLPVDWNGRFLFQGGGGLDGVLMPAIGLVSDSLHSRLPSALARGFAVASSDGGHEQTSFASAGNFGADPRALADYAYDSTRVVTRVAVALTRAYYKRAIRWSYFMGCSNGGREGMIAAQRYPALFDGVVAGSPAFDLTRAMVAEAWNTDVFAAIAPRNAAGRPNIADALSDADLHLLAGAVLARCDALDGVRDGLINDPAACHFDPSVLTCRRGQHEHCLSAEKVAAIRKVFNGPVDSKGHRLYSSWPYDTGVAQPGWRQWMLGSKHMPAINLMIAPAAINGVALGLRPPAIDFLKFNFDRDPGRIARVAAELDADSTDYSQLRRHHGKLLLYGGLSDPVFSANDLVDYYRRVISANGGLAATQRLVRLFLVPGMNHCGGGRALNQFDALSAMQSWVEHGRAPKRLLARGAAFPGRTGLLCPYPAVARYRGTGDVNLATSFACR